MVIRALLFAFFAAISGSALASDAAERIFTARDVVAEAHATDGVKAKALAHQTALTKAFEKVLHDLTRRRDHDFLPRLKGDALEPYLANYSVQDEHVAPTYYRATLTIQFNRLAILGLLIESGIGYTELRAPPLLVLPVMKGADGPVWADSAWREAWTRYVNPDGVVPIAVFNGSVEDRTYLDAMEDASRPYTLATMAIRYDAEYAVIAVLDPSENEGLAVRLIGRDIIGPMDMAQSFGGLRGAGTISHDAIIATVISEIENRWKAVAIDGEAPESLFVARAEKPTYSDGTRIEAKLVPNAVGLAPDIAGFKNRIADIPGVNALESSAGDRIQFAFNGDLSLLQSALAVRRLSLTRNGDQWWLAAY